MLDSKSFPNAMPIKFRETVLSWPVARKSPFSSSYYNSKDISWQFKPEGSLRISDHWNFDNSGKKHCVTDIPVRNKKTWALARYENGIYRVLEILPRIQHLTDITDAEAAKYLTSPQLDRRNRLMQQHLKETTQDSSDHIEHLLNMYFDILGPWSIDHLGRVSVDGDVSIRGRARETLTRLPVKFFEVSKEFNCSGSNLITLEGAPEIVDDFFCNSMPNLKNLQYGPKRVSGLYETQVSDFTYLPEWVEFFACDYHPNMNIAPLVFLNYNRILVFGMESRRHPITNILRKYTGSSVKRKLACTAELIEAGYKV